MRGDSKRLWRGAIRWSTGVVLAGSIMVVSHVFYAQAAMHNPGSWALTLAMAVLVGFMVGKPPLDMEDDWVRIGLESGQSDKPVEAEKPVEPVIKRQSKLVLEAPPRGVSVSVPQEMPSLHHIHFPLVPTRRLTYHFSQSSPDNSKEKVYRQFASDNPVCFLATVENGQPRVRTVFMWRADSEGYYFVLLSGKMVCRQLTENPRVEVCFYNHPASLAKAVQMRVMGRMEHIQDRHLIHEAAEARTYWSEIYGIPIEPYIEVFRLNSSDVRFWSMMNTVDHHPSLNEISL